MPVHAYLQDMNPENIMIRPILPADNRDLATIIRHSLEEFGAARPGTVYFDPSTDHLYELFQAPGSQYFTALADGQVGGGGGIYPSAGLPDGTCELVKMYLQPGLRGRGLGRAIIEKCLVFAAAAGYERVYIETLPELRKAMSVYEQAGFRYLDAPLGNTGHFGCDIWMLKDL
jgi:putative acetyltransferase